MARQIRLKATRSFHDARRDSRWWDAISLSSLKSETAGNEAVGRRGRSGNRSLLFSSSGHFDAQRGAPSVGRSAGEAAAAAGPSAWSTPAGSSCRTGKGKVVNSAPHCLLSPRFPTRQSPQRAGPCGAQARLSAWTDLPAPSRPGTPPRVRRRFDRAAVPGRPTGLRCRSRGHPGLLGEDLHPYHQAPPSWKPLSSSPDDPHSGACVTLIVHEHKPRLRANARPCASC